MKIEQTLSSGVKILVPHVSKRRSKTTKIFSFEKTNLLTSYVVEQESVFSMGYMASIDMKETITSDRRAEDLLTLANGIIVVIIDYMGKVETIRIDQKVVPKVISIPQIEGLKYGVISLHQFSVFSIKKNYNQYKSIYSDISLYSERLKNHLR